MGVFIDMINGLCVFMCINIGVEPMMFEDNHQ